MNGSENVLQFFWYTPFCFHICWCKTEKMEMQDAEKNKMSESYLLDFKRWVSIFNIHCNEWKTISHLSFMRIRSHSFVKVTNYNETKIAAHNYLVTITSVMQLKLCIELSHNCIFEWILLRLNVAFGIFQLCRKKQDCCVRKVWHHCRFQGILFSICRWVWLVAKTFYSIINCFFLRTFFSFHFSEK